MDRNCGNCGVEEGKCNHNMFVECLQPLEPCCYPKRSYKNWQPKEEKKETNSEDWGKLIIEILEEAETADIIYP